jgi:mannose-6-phosphate isomerase
MDQNQHIAKHTDINCSGDKQTDSKNNLAEPGGIKPSISEQVSMENNHLQQLHLKSQQYPWGKIGSQSLVARLLGEGNYDQNSPYAELWIGAHPNGSSQVLTTHGGNSRLVNLAEYIASDPEKILGNAVAKTFNASLPFLLKVLSVNKALSIQAHPDLRLAAELHKRDPKNYPDDNHKPEVAIALSPLKLLYNFRSVNELKLLLEQTPELSRLVGRQVHDDFIRLDPSDSPSYMLRQIYSAIVSEEKRDVLALETETLIARLNSKNERDANEQLVLDLFSTYEAPASAYSDIGIMSSLLMNIVTIPVGQSVYIGPNIPHAYLSGDLVECMANSDNVVRAGLTPKFQDVNTLVSMLNFEPGSVTPLSPVEVASNPSILRYHTPTREFVVDRVKENFESLQCQNSSSLQIFLCIAGSVDFKVDSDTLRIKAGEACFVSAEAKNLIIKNVPATDSAIQTALYRVSVPNTL